MSINISVNLATAVVRGLPLRLGQRAGVLLLVFPLSLGAQERSPVLRGTARLGDGALTSGTVVLHRAGGEGHGPVDSARVEPDGSFRFRLATQPGPNDLYFTSVLHDGVIYVGDALGGPERLDSAYAIQVYDTAASPADGVVIEGGRRNLFLESVEGGWRVTDIVRVAHLGDRTLVASTDAGVWSFPLPAAVRDVAVAEEDAVPSRFEVRDGRALLMSPLRPGAHMYVAHYQAAEPFLELALDGTMETVQIFVQEPAPPMEARGLDPMGVQELEPGLPFRRYAGNGVSGVVALRAGPSPPGLHPGLWALLLTSALAAVGVRLILSRRPSTVKAQPAGRRAVLEAIARLDAEFEAVADPTPEMTRAYQAEREGLIRTIAEKATRPTEESTRGGGVAMSLLASLLPLWFRKRRIWVRLTLSALLVATSVGGSFLAWAAWEQGRMAIRQAERFADSVHEMTMAGLTGMMITGTVDRREVFLEQIRESQQVASVRVLRGDAVTRQFGRGLSGELAAHPAEVRVLETGIRHTEVLEDERGARLWAVLPTLALPDYLGKNCLGCHTVPEGTVLGAVSVEISLDEVQASAAGFTWRSSATALLLLVPFGILIWFAITRSVTRPLRRLTTGLLRIADGDIESRHRLPVTAQDEIGEAASAFNLVMDRTIELLRSQRIYRTVFDHATEAITVTDGDGQIRAVNPAFEETTGYVAEEVVGKTPAILKSGRHDASFYEQFWSSLLDSGQWYGEIWNRRKDGSIYPESLSVVAVPSRSGEVEHFIGMFSDITDRKLREEHMEYQAFHDSLTGLRNRAAFMERLQQTVSLAKRHDHPAPSVMYMDLDRFKWINDTLGHDAGDEVLLEFSRRVIRCVRESDTVARLGGDEFAVLLPETSDTDGVLLVAAKIIEVMQEPMEINGQSLTLGVSIGFATYPSDGAEPEELIKRADAAMYRSKKQGGGCSALDPQHVSEG